MPDKLRRSVQWVDILTKRTGKAIRSDAGNVGFNAMLILTPLGILLRQVYPV